MSRPESAAPRRLPARVAVLQPGRGFFLQADFGTAPVPRALPPPAAIAARRVAFPAGNAFPADPPADPDPAARGTMRLSFSQIPRERIREAMTRLDGAVRSAAAA